MKRIHPVPAAELLVSRSFDGDAAILDGCHYD